MTEEIKEVIIYTDGACLGNPGPGGYGVVLLYNNHRKELSGGYRLTTNNRMEMLAAIVGLQTLKPQRCKVLLHTDSQYLANGISKGWAKRWRSNNWKLGSGGKAVNVDLWSKLLDLCDRHQVEFKWVRGHSGNVENERCDELAVAASKLAELDIDIEYEQATVRS